MSSFVIDDTDKSGGTFAKDNVLPSLPLPELKCTLERYIESVRPFVTAAELDRTKRIVEEFERGVGARLHAALARKAQVERNWVERWWEDEAYLKIRAPLIPYCNMDGVAPLDMMGLSPGPPANQMKHAALFGYNIIKFWQLLRQGRLKPTMSADKRTSFSMSQYRRLFNTVRVPGDNIDSLQSHFRTEREGPCSSTIVVLCRGRIFAFEALDASGEPLTPPVLEELLTDIRTKCDKKKPAPGVLILSCDERTKWSKNRRHLVSISQRNAQTMELIDKCMFVMVLDEDAPGSTSDITDCNLCGDYNNRLPDKSVLSIVYRNGCIAGLCDHTAFDGIVSISMMYYALLAVEEKKDWPREGLRLPPPAKELAFDTDDQIQAEIDRLQIDTLKQKNSVIMTRRIFTGFGKTDVQRLKLHPDSFIQMALQLTYQRLHGRPAPCYETATTRGYYNGRTETVRSCSSECNHFVAAMLNSTVPDAERARLLEKAVNKHDALMAEARDNAGCDRHLFGLYCTALEEGIEIPSIFTDSSYTKSGGGGNYVLSTSLTGYTPIGGGVAPMCLDGYGIFYNMQPKSLYFTVSSMSHSNETSALLFFDTLQRSLLDMRDVMLRARAGKSKL